MLENSEKLFLLHQKNIVHSNDSVLVTKSFINIKTTTITTTITHTYLILKIKMRMKINGLLKI